MRYMFAIPALFTVVAASAAVTVNSLTPGLNLQSLKVAGSGAGTGQLEVAVSNLQTSAVFTKTVTPSGGAFSAEFPGVDIGVEYAALVNGQVMKYAVVGRDHVWYDENGTTATTESPYGSWTKTSTIAINKESPNTISIVDGSDDGTGCAGFKPSHIRAQGVTTSTMKLNVEFSNAFDEDMLPDCSRSVYGFSMANLKDEETNDVTRLVLVDGGKWVEVPGSVFQPEVATEYVFEVALSAAEDGRKTIDYYLLDAAGAKREKLLRHTEFNGRPGSGVEGSFSFYGFGKIPRVRGYYYDDKLVDFNVVADNTTIGTNFNQNYTVGGRIVVTPDPGFETDMTDGVARIRLVDGRGNVVATRDVSFNGTQTFDFVFNTLDDGSNPEPGESYFLTYEIIRGGTVVADSGATRVVPTAQMAASRWIDEDASTFSRARQSTGEWLYDAREAWMQWMPSGKSAVRISTTDSTRSVYFDATNALPAAMGSSVREITLCLNFSEPGYDTIDNRLVAMDDKDLAGITLAQDNAGDGELHYSVYNPSNRTWTVLGNTHAELNQSNVVVIVINYSNPSKSTLGSVSYYRVDGLTGKREFLAAYEAVGASLNDDYVTRMRFSGSGYVEWIKGQCFDAHLAAVDDKEYWTIGEAIEAIGDTGKIITPLWPTTYTVKEQSGKFGIKDPSSEITFTWPLGYVVEETPDGDVRYYVFHLSDYWPDYAKVEDAVAVPNGWEVRSANGLAWLVKKSEEGALVGDITLTADITNLHEHVWIPVREFCGTFDGQNHRLGGLTDKDADICRTNGLDMTVYGLIGTAVDSTFRNLAFEDVAISNSADAVASMLGCSVGGLTLTNVVVRSGKITGGGQFVSGIVGYIADFGDVNLSKNLNAAEIVAADAVNGGVNASGIANLGTSGNEDGGKVTVVDNENRGTVATVVDSVVGGGNYAQILAGSDPAAKFSEVTATGNIGTGDVSRVVRKGDITALPVVNFSSEVAYRDGIYENKSFIEANNATDLPIDPWHKTARFSYPLMRNGDTNYAGLVNNLITRSLPGDTVTLPQSCEIWLPIELDRAITLDLDGKIIDNVFKEYTFNVSDGASAMVKNGTVSYPEGKLANRAVSDGWNAQNVNFVEWNTNYWDRQVMINNEPISSLSTMAQAIGPDAEIVIDEESGFSVDTEANALMYRGKTALAMAPLGFVVVDSGNGTYTVELDPEKDVPEINLSLSPKGDSFRVMLKGTKAGHVYSLQRATSLAEAFTTVQTRDVNKDGDTLEFQVEASAPSAFFKIKVENK